VPGRILRATLDRMPNNTHSLVVEASPIYRARVDHEREIISGGYLLQGSHSCRKAGTRNDENIGDPL
jgi:hypothetical protein